jgi:hypothetical protein
VPIRYIIVNTSNWWLGHKVILSPKWIDDIDWAESKLRFELTRQAIKDSPSYDPSAALGREQEAGIHAHYGRAGYWAREPNHAAVPHPRAVT